ncbi:MAG: hypothetical protein QXY40_06435 [Candidatus Methanomethylicia archaeon]
MSQTKLPYGPVKLVVDAIGFQDGRLIQFEIWMKKGEEEKLINQVNGVIRGGRGEALWIPPQEEYRVKLSREISTSEDEEIEEYYFKAKIDDLEVKSPPLIFTYPLEIYLEDEDGKPIDGAKYTITFSNGSKKEGVLQKGYAKIENAPKGRFRIEVEGYRLKE